MYKKGQIAQTVNWVVATIIIVVIITASVLISNSGVLNEGDWNLVDRQKDLIMTKSFTNFVEENFNLIENSVVSEDYDLLEKKSDEFLKTIDLSDEWNIDFSVDRDRKFIVGKWGSGGKYIYREIPFFFDINSKQIKLSAWIEDPQGYLYDSDYSIY